jgi:hypothetical protein
MACPDMQSRMEWIRKDNLLACIVSSIIKVELENYSFFRYRYCIYAVFFMPLAIVLFCRIFTQKQEAVFELAQMP